MPIPPMRQDEQRAVCCDELRSLRDCVKSGFARLEEQIKGTNEKVSDLSYHIVDPKRPQDTLPARVSRLEGFAKLLRVFAVSFIIGILTAVAAYIVNKLLHGGA